MLKNKKRLSAYLLAFLFVILCLFIFWEHYHEAKQVHTFAVLTQMVEDQKSIDREIDGCDAFECDGPLIPVPEMDVPTGKTSSLVLPHPSLMVASAGPLSAGSMQRLGDYDSSFTVEEAGTIERTILPQYQALHAQNPDFFGWIRIEGTKVNYPVMFSPQEPERYLYKDFYGNYAKYGVPFVDGVTDVEHSRNLLIHGHNARSGILFGDLDKFLKKSFWEEHRYIHLDTLYEERVYEIVAVVKTSIQQESGNVFPYYDYANIHDDSSGKRYLQELICSATNKGDTCINDSTGILTLSTCSYHVQEGRLVLIAIYYSSND